MGALLADKKLRLLLPVDSVLRLEDAPELEELGVHGHDGDAVRGAKGGGRWRADVAGVVGGAAEIEDCAGGTGRGVGAAVLGATSAGFNFCSTLVKKHTRCWARLGA